MVKQTTLYVCDDCEEISWDKICSCCEKEKPAVVFVRQTSQLTPVIADKKTADLQAEVDALGEQLAANHAKLQRAFRR